MPQPFTLRDDDISGLGMLYQVGWGQATPPGKIETFSRSSGVYGNITFPSGQGMQGVNIVVHRLEPFWPTPEAWESTSAVSGARFRRQSANPVIGSPPPAPPAWAPPTPSSRATTKSSASPSTTGRSGRTWSSPPSPSTPSTSAPTPSAPTTPTPSPPQEPSPPRLPGQSELRSRNRQLPPH
ncbi:hypothetical protein [Edaphobacter aggregans]|uniref:hypothetical protein n=1 Tax=Edaphobacter aggregans TaxID=570835 RepID=UPI0012F8ED7E|nr:hypothetical protein [Edaphobacter aggregans]